MRLPGIVQAPTEAALVPFQLLHESGSFDSDRIDALGLDPVLLLRIYRGIALIRIMDERLLTLQRQGRISFYGEARGQEAAVVGTAAALSEEDYVVPALREAGAGIYRGLSLRSYVAQIFGNANDVCKGRQMPCHPGSRAARYVTMSSCIATQLPHATGMAMAARLCEEQQGSQGRTVIAGYLGDGATSEGDFHVALNFAGVFRPAVVFVCQNNQWAISTPVTTQTASRTMAEKALAYGIPSVRVDGNDALACYVAMREVVARARAGGGPQFIEALTYRVSAHSSSDDPSRYRDESVTTVWRENRCPLVRFRRFLMARGLLSASSDADLQAEVDAEVRAAIAAEESAPAPPLASLVQDVFAQVPASLAEQLAEVVAALPSQKS
jgi:pyruvate dehydrogenase E1 component alpha subunit/2-oxoisovalerate dehydrogenase E1 component alpha subunit